MLNPVLFTLLEKYLDKTETLDEQTLEEVLEDEKQVPVDICNHALLVGFGRVGSLLGEKLMAQGIPLVVVETSRTRVDELRERGISAVLGNAANEEIMELAHLVDLQMSDQDAAVDADDLEYMYLFAVSGALGMLSHWLKKGTPQSPAEMSELLMSMIQHGVEERA